MSQVTGPIVIKNGAATPVDKSFLPMVVAPGSSIFTERSASASAGYQKLTVNYSPANGGRKTNRTEILVDVPVTEVVAGVDTVTRTLRFQGTFIVPDTATSLERSDLVAFVANALDVPIVRGVIKDNDPLY